MIQRGSGQPPRVRSTFPPQELYSDSGRPFGAPSRQTPVKPRACMSVYGGLVPLGLSHSSFLWLTIWYHIRKPLAIPFETTAKREIVVYSFQTHFVLTVGEPFMAPVEQYVFAEVRSNIGRFHCREP